MDIAGARILITGGARGLGRTFALDLAAGGARVGACDLDADGLADLERVAADRDLAVWTAPADVADETSVERVFEGFVAVHGGIDAVVNNAGLNRDGLLVRKKGDTVERLPLASWQAVIDVDLTGVFLCGREAAYHMVGQGTGGVIVSISSLSRQGNVGQTNYAAAKAGIVAMTRTWAMELARHGIRAVAVSPGLTATEMALAMPEEARRRLTESIPLRRMATPEEIGHGVRFALENEFVTGKVIDIDGGLRL
ncbi:MAG: SDR family oxidoreductase [Thermoleophilia bacterium]|jgi:3-oxoacyl-[acyl-carrier protein] reductase|nr:SDR family oxidoreductase [Thermoleophilia bacterium]